MDDKELETVKNLFNKYEKMAERAIAAENLLMEIVEMSWYKRILYNKKILKHLKTILKHE